MHRNYDFLLFENFYRAVNHNKDVDIIAGFLTELGYEVAIVDVCPLNQYHFMEGIPVLHTTHQFRPLKGRSKLLPERLCNIFDDYRWNWHLHKVMKEMKGRYKHLYVGSYYTKMIPIWFRDIPKTSSVFFWGLRSFWLQEYKYSHSLRSVNSYFLYRMVKINKNLKFFVSDENIKKEFLDLGIEPGRLVLRYERFVKEMPPARTYNSVACKFLSIGSLRRDKRIERIANALKNVSMPYQYVIAGKSAGNYEAEIEKAIAGNSSITRMNKRLSEEEFNDLMDTSSYLVLCDVRPPSCVTNGTMNEALLKGMPIIAPNYNPYKSAVEEYGVGLLFDPNEEGALQKALEKAIELGPSAFSKGIVKYQQTLLYETVLNAFNRDLKESLKA